MVTRNPDDFDRGDLEAPVDGMDDSHTPNLKDKLEGGVHLHDSATGGGILPVIYVEEILPDREENLLDVPTGCLLDQSIDGVEVELLRPVSYTHLTLPTILLV